ncbi:PAS domain-containing protein [Methanogenium sp. S4BF]|uniref:PAS domain-containing protein n=1 Tax=Methanogenium sp. S4BF TaxID=1789226 RepID=UPI0024168137|nr:PAS domain-containing protein [Methanogenium sp. S4BF]WFN35104.1 PAS domain-containing protein [Methanogenium sp. S4BF]
MPGKEGTPQTTTAVILHTILPQVIQNTDHLIIFCTDDTGEIFLWNRAAEILTGYSHAEVPDMATLLRVAYPDSTYREIIASVRDTFRKKSTKSVHYETKIKTKNKQIRYISWTIERIPETVLSPQLYVTTGTDVTHARQSESDALLLSEIVNSSHDAIVGISPDGSILTWNRAAEEIFGYEATESIGEPFSRHIPDEKKDFFASILMNVTSGQDFRGNIACLSKAQKMITTSITFSPISGEEGAVEGISAIIRDMTQELSMQQTMRGYISEATMRLNHPAELVEGNITSLIERIREGDFDDEDILIELQVQQKALSQINHNLRELSQAIIGHFKDTEEVILPDTIQ